MEDFEKIYQYGSRGIDTQYERELINYEPVLEYIKRVAPYIKLTAGFTPSHELDYATQYNIPNTLAALERAKSATQRLIEALQEKLKDVKVLIEEPFKEKMEALKAYAGGDYITFIIFDKSCREDSQEAQAVMFYFMEKSDSVEALMYPDAILLDTDTDFNTGFMKKDCTELAYAIGYSSEKSIEEATADWVARRAELENQIASLESQKEIIDPITWDQYNGEIDQMKERLDEINHYDTIPVISRVVTDRANSTYDSAVKLYGLTIAQISGVIGGSIALESLIGAIGINIDDDEEDIAEQINKIKKRIEDIKKIVSIANSLSSIRAIDLTSLLMMILKPILKEVANQLISVFGRMKVELIKPVLDWLDDLSDELRLVPMSSVPNNYKPITQQVSRTKIGGSADKAVQASQNPSGAFGSVVQGIKSSEQKLLSFSQAVDDLAHTIIDVANNVEDKFEDFILDFYKSTTARADALNEKMTNCQKKKWAQAIYKVLDAMLICLEAVRDPMALKDLENVESYIDRIKSKLDWDNDDTNFLNPVDAINEAAAPTIEPIVERIDWSKDVAE
jgi:hypothetical protein